MRAAVNILGVLVTIGGMCWIVFGEGVLTLPLRVGVVLGALFCIGITAYLVHAHRRRQRLERNLAYYANGSWTFSATASIQDVFHRASFFHSDSVRIEQLARGLCGNVEVEVYDVSWQVTSRDSAGSTTVHTVTQTVASIPVPERPHVALRVAPLRGISGNILRFLGLTGSATPAVKSVSGDPALAEWFNRKYTVVWEDDASRQYAEVLLDSEAMQWIRDHDPIAFEVSDQRLFVWRPQRLIDSEERDRLVEDGLRLITMLSLRHAPGIPALSLSAPAVASLKGMMLRLVISAFASWLVAASVMFASFFAAIQLGWVKQAPLPTVAGIMSLSICVWIASGLLVYTFISRKSP